MSGIKSILEIVLSKINKMKDQCRKHKLKHQRINKIKDRRK